MFEQAAAQGQTILNAAGDEGDDSCNEIESVVPPSDQNPLSVADPASQPYVLGRRRHDDPERRPAGGRDRVERRGRVGRHRGRDLAVVGDAELAAELAGPGDRRAEQRRLHERQRRRDPVRLADGVLPGTIEGATASTPCRLVPDVSADADEFTGAVTIFTSGGGWTTIGGTSSSSPIWAAMLALVNSSARARRTTRRTSASPHRCCTRSPRTRPSTPPRSTTSRRGTTTSSASITASCTRPRRDTTSPRASVPLG